MEKTLRSLIHEKFDLDVRYEIELLSRRRDLINEEKQEELIKLLQSKNIENIVPLGPGTNRYAFKLDGFVIKVATDHDGKIDNLKEFKMAKRLYPYVTKTYEVSENGTILVAEYIQPFESFTEMCQYAEKIREILTKLSSVYLIGDVGITPNNFANWGLRVGTKDPVCLDFAYVYEVSSELFLCQYCNAHAMLSPNKDFTELHCTNPACGRRYLFEDIRAKIGNDIHRHEIGDLSLEGYRMLKSHTHTVLDEQRSNYLVKKRDKPKEKEEEKKKQEETPFVDNFVMPQKIIQGGIEMSENITNAMNNANAMAANRGGVIHVQARASIVSTSTSSEQIPTSLNTEKLQKNSLYGVTGKPVQATVIQGSGVYVPDDLPDESTLAFSGEMQADPVILGGGILTAQDNGEMFSGVVVGNEKKPYARVEPPQEESKPKVVTATASIVNARTVTPPIAKPAAQPTTVVPKPQIEVPEENVKDKGPYKFPDNIRNPNVLKDMISNLTNRIKHELHMAAAFDDVRAGVRDKKLLPEMFYKNVQNAAFRTLVSFCNFSEHEEPREDGKGNRLVFTPPEDLYGEYLDTLIFIVEFNKFMSSHRGLSHTDLMDKYRKAHPKYPGIQREWIPKLEQRMVKKMPIDVCGAKKIASIICDMYCVPEGFVKPEPVPDPDPTTQNPVDPPAGAEAAAAKEWTAAELREIAAEALRSGVVNVDILNEVDDNGKMDDLLIETVKEFGVAHYGQELDCSDPENIMVAKFIVDVNGQDYTVGGYINIHTSTFRFMMDDATIIDMSTTDSGELFDSLINLDLDAMSVRCSSLVQSIVECNNMEFNPAAEILQGSDDIVEEDGNAVGQKLCVDIYPDDNFDIIKVSSADVFGDIAIPFYAKLDEVDANNPPSLIDDRNGIWDWLTVMVPDLMFRTTRPEYFMQVNTDDPDEYEVHIVILDENDGVYTMGIYYLVGVYVCNDDGEMEPCFDMDLLAKLNRIICEDTSYGRISHLKRSLSMTQLINSEEYILNDVFHGQFDDLDDDDEDGAPEPEDLSIEEQAALAVIMHGASALPDDASDEAKELANKMHNAAYSAIGVPPVTPDDQHVHPTETHVDHEATETEVSEVEETFEVNVPPAVPAEKKPEESSEPTFIEPIRRHSKR